MKPQIIRYKFNEAKATEAAALLLKKTHDRMNYVRLIKLLYLAERESLREHGRPIFGDVYVSMKHGPVLSNVYELIRDDEFTASEIWTRFIKKQPGYFVGLQADPGTANLSSAETEILDLIEERYHGQNEWDLRDLLHTFPEWKDPGNSSTLILVEEILRAVGKTDGEIEAIQEEAEQDFYLDQLLGS